MAFIYNGDYYLSLLENFQPLPTPLETAVKIQELTQAYVALNEHFVQLDAESRLLDEHIHSREVAIITELKCKYVDNLVQALTEINEREELRIAENIVDGLVADVVRGDEPPAANIVEAQNAVNAEAGVAQAQAQNVPENEPQAPMDVENRDFPYNALLEMLKNVWMREQFVVVSRPNLYRVYRALEEVRGAISRIDCSFTAPMEAINVSFFHTRLDFGSQVMLSYHLNAGHDYTLSALMNFLLIRRDNIQSFELDDHEGADRAGPAAPEAKRSRGVVCPRCQHAHPLHKCAQFSALTLAARVQTVVGEELCHNCFSADHATNDCAKGTCKRCDVKHNSLLCPRSGH